MKQDVAFFLLARGPFAWLGWGTWGMDWPFSRRAEPCWDQNPPPPLLASVPRPPEIDADYGEPTGLCREASPGVFAREWSKAQVELDCNTFRADMIPK